MAHHTLKNGYQSLYERLDLFPQFAPASESLFKILAVMMSETEAAVMSKLPIRPFTLRRAARALKMHPRDAEKVLDELASRAVLLDQVSPSGDKIYTLPPPMAGFFEFSMMRVRGDIDQKTLAELFYQYLNVEEDFVRELFATGPTKYGKTYVNERASDTIEVLDCDRVSKLIEHSEHIGVGTCYCRHKMAHLGRACSAPLDICMTFGGVADSLIRHGHARRVTPGECMDLLTVADKHHLVQFGENQQDGISFVCNCCGCCCEALLAVKRFGIQNTVITTDYLPAVESAKCSGCGLCVKVCPMGAVEMQSVADPAGPARQIAVIDTEKCLGCALCVKSCARSAMILVNRGRRIMTPVNQVHRVVLMAIDRGRLQNLIFDNQAHLSHRMMASVLGAILRLPPVKRAMASEQMQSKYLAALLRK